MQPLRSTLTALAVAGLSVVAVGTTVPEASAAVTCSKWAATSGSDAAAGTQAAPYRSLGKLAASLRAGEAGCLPAGKTYFAVAGNGIVRGSGGTQAAPVTITSGPGGRASVKGQLEIGATSHDIKLTGIDFQGGYAESGAPLYTKSTHLILHGDRITIADNDISDPRGICITGGRGHATDPNVNDVAEDLRVTGNRIHDCGMDPSIVWNVNDSGSHGIYLENTLRARVSENLVYRNRWRGLQLWPRNNGAVIERNVFDQNATHVNIGSSLGEYGGAFMAQNTSVRDNVFSGRVTSFTPSQNPSQLYGFFPANSPNYGNSVTSNCFAPGDPAATGSGFSQSGNTVAQAQFANRESRDYRLVGSSCDGDGPSGGGTTVDRSLTVSAPAAAATGDEMTVTLKVQNKTATAGSATVAVTPTNAKLLGLSTSTGTCTASACTGTLSANGSQTITARLGAIVPGTSTLTGRLSDTDASPNDNSASGATTISGNACTYTGTDGGETAQGTPARDVLCLFGGDDTVLPGAGDDIVVGGSGTDRLSYWNAANAAVINLGQSAAWDSGAGTAIGWDQFRGIEWGTGTAFADTLIGGAANDILDGLEGADEIWGYGGADTLKGWSGNDRLNGGDGNDTLDGGEGNDACDQGLGTGSKTSCEA